LTKVIALFKILQSMGGIKLQQLVAANILLFPSYIDITQNINTFLVVFLTIFLVSKGGFFLEREFKQVKKGL